MTFGQWPPPQNTPPPPKWQPTQQMTAPPMPPMGMQPQPEKTSPWLWVGIGCGGVALLGLCLVPPLIYLLVLRPSDSADDGPITGPSTTPPVVAPALPGGTDTRRVTFSVTEVQGLSGVAIGTRCAFDVSRHDRPDGTFWCNAQVTCGGPRLLYGGPTAGYFDCTLYEPPQRHVVGEDRWTTGQDRDAALRVDTLGGEVLIRDDAQSQGGAFLLRGSVTSVE